MDIIDHLTIAIHHESAAASPNTTYTIEVLRLAIEEIQELKKIVDDNLCTQSLLVTNVTSVM
jgi:hypothetical protein